ncbi:serine hydrolase domain-containing protein [Streptosporangium sp. KLBMP 9127]|nr:beta-lactamase family protein [Streptosporangium sp. KLBMP 9127]
MNAPPGIARAVRTPWFDLTECTGHRTVRWVDGERVGEAPMTIDTHHDLASITKILATTTALIRLVSGGLVDLDAPVRRYLPDCHDGCTVRDLLLHRAGLWEWYPLYIQREMPPPRYRPGQARHYSDLGFVLLGRVVAAVTGLPLDRAVSELVTEPLGLSSTRYARPAGPLVSMSARDDRVEMGMLDSKQPYPVPYGSADFDGWRRRPVIGEVSDGNAHHAFGGVSGHAGLFSTLPDLLRYCAALSRYREHDGLWRPEVAEEFFAPGPDAQQALGFRRYDLRIRDETVTVLGHPGYVGCAVGFVPGRDISLVVASNRLLVDGTPVPTDTLWHDLLTATTRRSRTA